MKKVVGLGACVMDTLISCNDYPTEDTKMKAESVFTSGGGPVGNALVVMAKLGVNTFVTGNLADDNAGDYLVEDFNKYCVNTDYVCREKNTSSFTSYILLNSKKNSRTCVFDRGTVSDDPSNLDFSVLDDADVLHLDGNYLGCAIAAAKYAKEHGVKVSLDAGGLYKDIDKLLPLVDILIPSAEFSLGFTGEKQIPQAMRMLKQKFNPLVLVVTDGANGGYYMQDDEILHYDSVKVEQVVDTNGAGDTFHGAFITAYCDGKSVEDCCHYASVVAGYKVSQKGARTYPLNRSIIDQKL